MGRKPLSAICRPKCARFAVDLVGEGDVESLQAWSELQKIELEASPQTAHRQDNRSRIGAHRVCSTNGPGDHKLRLVEEYGRT